MPSLHVDTLLPSSKPTSMPSLTPHICIAHAMCQRPHHKLNAMPCHQPCHANCHATPITMQRQLPTATPLTTPCQTLIHTNCQPPYHTNASKFNAVMLSPATSCGRDLPKRSSPSKRAHACSPPDSQLNSPPHQHRRHHASMGCSCQSPNPWCSHQNPSSKSKGKSRGQSFFQGGTAAHGSSTCTWCCWQLLASLPRQVLPAGNHWLAK